MWPLVQPGRRGFQGGEIDWEVEMRRRQFRAPNEVFGVNPRASRVIGRSCASFESVDQARSKRAEDGPINQTPAMLARGACGQHQIDRPSRLGPGLFLAPFTTYHFLEATTSSDDGPKTSATERARR